MKRFVQLHLLTSYPPSNVNRDDLGRPKTAMMGGANRLRISSQSLKRAWRMSDVFRDGLDGHLGTRTKRMGLEIFEEMKAAGAKESDAKKWAKEIAGAFGKLKAGKSSASDGEEVESSMPELEVETLAHFGPEEVEAVKALGRTCAERGEGPKADELAALRLRQSAADVALFGRMLAEKVKIKGDFKFNVEAAAQVAHAITVHKVAVENDYFTAVDDLNKDDPGASHIGETEFGAGLFYLYICVDRHLLVENLGGDEALAKKTLAGLAEAVAKVAPKGKQNSFGSTAHAIYCLAETGDQQPRSLSVAFLKPVYGEDVAERGIKELEQMRANMEAAYDSCADAHHIMNVPAGQGSLKEIIKFVQE